MGLRGPQANTKRGGDFLVALPFGEELDDFALADSQPLAAIAILTPGAFISIDDVREKDVRDSLREIGLVPSERFDRFDKKLRRFGF